MTMTETSKTPDLFHMRVDPEFLAMIDEIRGSLRPIPSRAEAIRIAVREKVGTMPVAAPDARSAKAKRKAQP